MQRFLDENAVAWFSLTGHPTNPNTVDYYVAETDVARVLSRARCDQRRSDRYAAGAARHAHRRPRKTPLRKRGRPDDAGGHSTTPRWPQKDLFEKPSPAMATQRRPSKSASR